MDVDPPRTTRSPFVDPTPTSPRKRSNAGPISTESPTKKASFDEEGDSFFVSQSEQDESGGDGSGWDDGFGGDYGDDEDSGNESEQDEYQEHQKRTGWFR